MTRCTLNDEIVGELAQIAQILTLLQHSFDPEVYAETLVRFNKIVDNLRTGVGCQYRKPRT